MNGWPEILIYLNLLCLFVFRGVALLTLSSEDPQPNQWSVAIWDNGLMTEKTGLTSLVE